MSVPMPPDRANVAEPMTAPIGSSHLQMMANCELPSQFIPTGSDGHSMKLATYNVNGVNGRLPVLLRWLAESQPDIACLQELKAPQEKFPHEAIRKAGYHALWHG